MTPLWKGRWWGELDDGAVLGARELVAGESILSGLGRGWRYREGRQS